MIDRSRFCSQCGRPMVRRSVDGRLRDVCRACEAVYRRNPLPVAAGVVLNREREVLLVKRRRDPYKGAWCLPMGFAECGETANGAVLRELREETGIEGRILRLLDVDSFLSDCYGDLLIVTFEVEEISGCAQAGDDDAAVAYFPIHRLPALAFPSNEEAIRICRRIHREEWMLQDARLPAEQRCAREATAEGDGGSADTMPDPPPPPPRKQRSRMRCPFLIDTRVRRCAVAPFPKLIPAALIHKDDELCSSNAYRECPTAQQHTLGQMERPHCPHIEEVRVQYCAAAPVTKFIPCMDNVASRCMNGGHRYCQIYLQRAHLEELPKPNDPGEAIPVPGDRVYTMNHMWVDAREDGTCQIGIDAFLARVLGEVERVGFPSGESRRVPAVVLTVRGVELPLTFPHRMTVTDTNVLLRTRPETLCRDPYRSGWLFAGEDLEPRDDDPAEHHARLLLRGKAAEQWMRDEAASLSLLVGELVGRRSRHHKQLLNDGGTVRPRLAQHLSRSKLRYVFNSFFGGR